MGLDITLKIDETYVKESTGIYVRENGSNRELSYDEAKQRYPDTDIELLSYETDEVWSGSITHNLNKMAMEVDAYELLWYPEKVFPDSEVIRATQLVAPLAHALAKLIEDKERLQEFNPENGWGHYDNLVKFVTDYIVAGLNHPNAVVEVCR